jgi:hypothetical protein
MHNEMINKILRPILIFFIICHRFKLIEQYGLSCNGNRFGGLSWDAT